MQEAGFLSAAEAARFLGVRLTTLYAYASRGLLRSRGRSRTEGHVYDRADLERLRARSHARRGHTAVAAGALRWGEPVLDSAITAIDHRGPRFRGHLATELVQSGATFEQVAELLWTGTLPPRVPRWRDETPDCPVSRDQPLGTLFSVLSRAAVEERFEPLEREEELSRARGLLIRLARHVGRRAHRARGTVAATLAGALRLAPSSAEVTRAIDTALVLLSDHELNVSSFAARVTASAGSGLAACMLAGYAALTGARHGGASTIIESWAREIGSPARVPRAVQRLHERGETLEGFRHTLYPAGDPRAAPLLELAERLDKHNPRVRVISSAIRALQRRGGRPNVDVGLAALTAALGAPPGTGTILFAIGRCAGWVAHILEQREAGYLLRPRARYVGV